MLSHLLIVLDLGSFLGPCDQANGILAAIRTNWTGQCAGRLDSGTAVPGHVRAPWAAHDNIPPAGINTAAKGARDRYITCSSPQHCCRQFRSVLNLAMLPTTDDIAKFISVAPDASEGKALIFLQAGDKQLSSGSYTN